MQVDRLLARLTRPAAILALLLGIAPAAAQDAAESVPQEPLPMFKAVCMGGGARLNRKNASEANFSVLPDPARRALGKVAAKDNAGAVDAGTAEAAAVTNRIYQLGAGQLYLLVPSAPATPTTPLADSCMVLWQSAGDEDYLAARKVVMPNEDSVPLYLRPNSKPDGFVFATSAEGSSRLTIATYGGWIVLRSSSDTPPANPQ